MVKRFLQAHGGKTPAANRFAPEIIQDAPPFKLLSRKAIGPDDDELEVNPRARSAKLRVAERTDAPARAISAKEIAMPDGKGRF